MNIVVVNPAFDMAAIRQNDLWGHLRRVGGIGTQLLQNSTGVPIPPPEIIWSTVRILVGAMRRDEGRQAP
ncbi:hypothetical protein C0V97_09925 [Asaia sp. W19]|uniref:hypothetical protein n=1 Tax=unclassified Asaia TaxID=2685023 RepID=UPI000F8D46A2|nr:hypothetical protein [Asaia sp. W19]RUT25710.1 hypothetical protein C0V97_09925 [Asaia sp. W19]